MTNILSSESLLERSRFSIWFAHSHFDLLAQGFLVGSALGDASIGQDGQFGFGDV